LRANGEPIDSAHIFFREVGGRTVPDVNAIRVEQEDRRKHPRALQLNYSQQRIEHLVKGFAPGDQLEHEALAFKYVAWFPSAFYVHTRPLVDKENSTRPACKLRRYLPAIRKK
jgi:hypothetical protein